jgi:hypothetical protein
VTLIYQANRSGKSWVVQPIHTAKSNWWKKEIADVVLGCAESALVPDIQLPENTATGEYRTGGEETAQA